MDFNCIKTTYFDSIARISFSNEKANSLSLNTILELTKSIKIISKNRLIKSIIIESSGNTFCSGANLKELINYTSFKDHLFFFKSLANLFLAFISSTKIIICRCHAKTIGGGVGILCASDYCIGVKNYSDIKLSEITIGLAPSVIAPLIKHKTNASFLNTLTFNPEKWHVSEEVYTKGIYNELCFSLEDLDKIINTFSKKINSFSHKAIETSKKISWDFYNWNYILQKNAKLSAKLTYTNFFKDKITLLLNSSKK